MVAQLLIHDNSSSIAERSLAIISIILFQRETSQKTKTKQTKNTEFR